MEKPHAHAQHIPPLHNVPGEPTTAWELINKYGTYNIQPTADTENPYPAIAQGRPYAEGEEMPSARSQQPKP